MQSYSKNWPYLDVAALAPGESLNFVREDGHSFDITRTTWAECGYLVKSTEQADGFTWFDNARELRRGIIGQDIVGPLVTLI